MKILTTPSPAACVPLVLPVFVEDTEAATKTDTRFKSPSALMSTFPSFTVTFVLFPSSARTAVSFTIVLTPMPALLEPPYATEPAMVTALTLDAAVTVRPSVRTRTTFFPTRAFTVSCATNTVKEPAPVKLVAVSAMEPPTASR